LVKRYNKNRVKTDKNELIILKVTKEGENIFNAKAWIMVGRGLAYGFKSASGLIKADLA